MKMWTMQATKFRKTLEVIPLESIKLPKFLRAILTPCRFSHYHVTVLYTDRKIGSFRMAWNHNISLKKMFANAFLHAGNILSYTRVRTSSSSTPCIAMCLVTRSSNSDWHRSKASSINNHHWSSESSSLPSSSSFSSSASSSSISLSSVSALSLYLVHRHQLYRQRCLHLWFLDSLYHRLKECALSTGKLPRRLAQEQCG